MNNNEACVQFFVNNRERERERERESWLRGWLLDYLSVCSNPMCTINVAFEMKSYFFNVAGAILPAGLVNMENTCYLNSTLQVCVSLIANLVLSC